MTNSMNEQLRDIRCAATPGDTSRLAGKADPLAEPAPPRTPTTPPAPDSRLSTAPPSGRSGAAQRKPPYPFVSGRRLRLDFGLEPPYSEGKRLGYGLLWTGWTLLLGIAGIALLPHGATVLSGLIAFALAIVTGRYAYRIWTWQAKRLIFFIIW